MVIRVSCGHRTDTCFRLRISPKGVLRWIYEHDWLRPQQASSRGRASDRMKTLQSVEAHLRGCPYPCVLSCSWLLKLCSSGAKLRPRLEQWPERGPCTSISSWIPQKSAVPRNCLAPGPKPRQSSARWMGRSPSVSEPAWPGQPRIVLTGAVLSSRTCTARLKTDETRPHGFLHLFL